MMKCPETGSSCALRPDGWTADPPSHSPWLDSKCLASLERARAAQKSASESKVKNISIQDLSGPYTNQPYN